MLIDLHVQSRAAFQGWTKSLFTSLYSKGRALLWAAGWLWRSCSVKYHSMPHPWHLVPDTCGTLSINCDLLVRLLWFWFGEGCSSMLLWHSETYFLVMFCLIVESSCMMRPNVLGHLAITPKASKWKQARLWKSARIVSSFRSESAGYCVKWNQMSETIKCSA